MADDSGSLLNKLSGYAEQAKELLGLSGRALRDKGGWLFRS